MSLSDDPLVDVDVDVVGGDGREPVREPISGWRSAGGRTAFWTVALIGTVLPPVAWFWYGLCFFDEMTEESKAAAAGTTSAGTGLLLAGPPLVFAHLLLLVPLLVIGGAYRSRRVVGILLAVVVVAAASALGIAVNEVLWQGQLFAMSATQQPAYIP